VPNTVCGMVRQKVAARMCWKWLTWQNFKCTRWAVSN